MSLSKLNGIWSVLCVGHNLFSNKTDVTTPDDSLNMKDPYPRPEDMNFSIPNYTFVDNDQETMRDLLNSLYVDKTSMCSNVSAYFV